MRWIGAAAIFLLMAVIGHLIILNAIPSRIMSTAQARMADRGVGMYQWFVAPRMTPQTQTIVRPSPDLAYAICRFDVSDEPVLLTAPSAETYGSLSIFDSKTNNVFIARLDGAEAFAGVVVSGPGASAEGFKGVPDGAQNITMRGKGLALIRRLAPDQATHNVAAGLVDEARCEQLAN